ncbi:phosphoribosylanthranilate isomerase [Streptococcus panodentis]|uniref:N-(5'-phosphoribosyl)anthranilate isomerase n=1 Tax=Streptococcus panodentis TaxID=1581472 RepID=A0ABS5AY67_9STRE|nr:MULTISPECIES: phosphoribosylanthranilate isomerase [Streptococcus]KXT81555.1 Phosphoribosylanthranilate isomerase [Streptococcus sp. DD11]MBP2621520.1 phosphoribosylanthranilate isomerase [Streptococcus panodentis]
MTKVKICGLSSPEAVQAAVAAGADYIGFVFAESRRQISPEKAAQLSKLIPPTVKTVGVFVSPCLEELQAVMAAADLDLLQIHGEFDEALLPQLGRPVIRAYQVKQGLGQVSRAADYILFDAPLAGSGQTFDWQTADTSRIEQPFFIAGGLTADNVGAAIEHFSPYAVDVSSGVETDGRKDKAKIQAFIERVKHGI